MARCIHLKSKKLMVFVAVALVLTVAYATYFLVLEYKVHSKACEIRKAGYPASPEELEKWYDEPVSGNAAGFYLETFKNFASKPENVDEESLMICGSAEVPSAGTAIFPEMMKTAENHLMANGKDLELVHKAARMNSCRFPVEISDPERNLAYHSKLRQAAKLLYLESLVSAEEGDNARAFGAALDSCRLASSLENEPLPDSFIIQMALQHMAMDCVGRLIAKGCLDEGQLKMLGLEVARFEGMKSLERAYAGERSLVLSEYYLEEFMEYAIYDFPGSVRKNPFLKKTVFFLFDVSCLRMINNLSCIGFLTELVELTKEKPENIMADINRIDGRIKNLPSYLFAVKIYMPHLCSITDKKLLLVSRARTLLAAIAVESYLAKNGKLPETLSSLVPEYFGAVPVDPVAGKPILYRKTEKGFIAYSTGADGKDDNGNPGSNGGFSAGEDFSVRIER